MLVVQVYDATPFLRDHPGGGDSILIVAGTDATEEFNAIHSDKAKAQLLEYCIGELADENVPRAPPHALLGPQSALAANMHWLHVVAASACCHITCNCCHSYSIISVGVQLPRVSSTECPSLLDMQDPAWW